jgi:putative ABC transport system permease protein
LKLVLVIVCLGGVIGTETGLYLSSGMLQLYTQYYHFPVLRYQVSLALILGTIAISASAAIIGAFVAVRKAVSLPPAEAMRPEPPAHFRRTLMERLGLQALLSPVGRIILRNLERKPIQAILSIVGIALAIGMLIVGQYSTNAFNYLVNVQFRLMQRDDVTAIFAEPLSARVRYEVERLPGVLYAEPFRSVAVRLRHQQYTRQLGILGLEPGGQLHRLVDRHLQVIQLPSAGVLLTAKLGEILHIQPGETLTIEVLEGDRPTHSVLVAGFVDDLVGLSAYMERAAQAGYSRAEAAIAQAQATLTQAQRDRKRAQELAAAGAVPRRDREAAELTEITRSKELESAKLAAKAAAAEVNVARAALTVLQDQQRDPDYLLKVYDAQIASIEADLAKLKDEAARTEIRAPIGAAELGACLAFVMAKQNSD